MTGTTGASPAMAASWTGLVRLAGSPARAGVLVICGFTLLRLALVPFVGLQTNEAYAIACGRHFALSYFDHPPLHFWFAHLCALLFGDTRYARIPFIFLGAGTSWLMFRLTRGLYGEKAALWAVLSLNLSIFFSLLAGNWILPDGPLNFFLLATALALSPLAAKGGIPGPRRWILAGIGLGFAALAKYHAALFAVSVFFLIATDPARRRILLSPWPYLGLVISAAIFSPVLVWNAGHHWLSFAFQGGRAAGAGALTPGLFLTLLAAQIAMLSPWIVVPLGPSIARGWRGGPAGRYCLWLGLPLALFMTLAPLWSGNGMFQWAMPGWLLLFPLLGDYLASRAGQVRWPRRWAAWSTAGFAAFAVLAASDAATGWAGAGFPEFLRKGDPMLENLEWTGLAGALNRKGARPAEIRFVVAFDWRSAARLDQAFGGRLPVTVFSRDPRSFGFLADTADYVGRDALIVAPPGEMTHHLPALQSYFAQTVQAGTIALGRSGRSEMTLSVVRGENLRRPFPAAYGTR